MTSTFIIIIAALCVGTLVGAVSKRPGNANLISPQQEKRT